MGLIQAYPPFEPIPPKNEGLSCPVRADLTWTKGNGRGELLGLARSGVLVMSLRSLPLTVLFYEPRMNLG